MHVGHIRSTIIGESLSRLFDFFGHSRKGVFDAIPHLIDDAKEGSCSEFGRLLIKKFD